MALDATLGGVAANSYVTQAAASSYFSGRLDVDAWNNASSSDKDAALMMATMRLDAETYNGYKVTYTQRLHWPRFSTFDRDGMLHASDSIPLVIQQATFEYALALLKDSTLMSDTGLEGFVNVQLGNLNVTPRVLSAVRLPAIVKQLIAPVRKGGYNAAIVQRA
jgi:hypothetical protein